MKKIFEIRLREEQRHQFRQKQKKIEVDALNKLFENKTKWSTNEPLRQGLDNMPDSRQDQEEKLHPLSLEQERQDIVYLAKNG